jgi:diguanylate cyclase (GGDEF)-like protein
MLTRRHEPTPLRRLRARSAAALAWLVVVTAAVGLPLAAIEHLVERYLLADAERSAVGWARHIASNVPDLDLVFMGEPATQHAQDHLAAMRGVAGLFRFKLFDTRGRLLLVSESLATPAPSGDDEGDLDAVAAAVARGARGEVALERGDGVQRPAVYSEAYVPVLHGGRPAGVVQVFIDQSELAATTASSFQRAALAAGSALALFFACAVALWRRHSGHVRHAEERVHFLARHDVLTGALNAATLREGLAQACAAVPRAPAPDATGAPDPGAAPAGLAVLCIDLDRFSDVNDAHGRATGDELLRQVAARLRDVLRGADLLGRLAGDRFAVLQREVADSAAVRALAQRVVDSLAQPHRLPGLAGEITVTASVGAAIHGVDGDDADALLHAAELALQRAKSGGSARWSFYDAALDRVLQERRALAHDLRDAIARDALKLHFQPVFAAGEGQRLIGYEALARWPHPLRGFVPPSEFIPVAEETGQIEALGRWVLASACREAASWPQPLAVAVNLSPAQFRQPGAIVAEVRAALADSGLAPARLELEITESLLMSHTEQVLATLRELHALGVRIAMDDFGTGYSSLAYLWRFPFDKLKIDRAFTQGLGADGKVDVIVRSIVTLAHSLGIRVNAEGVETAEQHVALRRHGCDELQGYLLGRPQPVERLLHREAAAHAPDTGSGALAPVAAVAAD